MARIGIDGDVLAKGTRFGDEKYLWNLVRGLIEIDHSTEYRIYARRADIRDLISLISTANGNYLVKKVFPSSLWLKVPLSLPLALLADRCDLLHTQYFVPPFHPGRVVLTIHDISFMRHPEFFSRKEAWLFRLFIQNSARRADRIITDTHFTKKEICHYFRIPAQKVRVVPLSVDPFFRPGDPQAAFQCLSRRYDFPFDRFLLCVGEIQPRKNTQGLIRAFSRLRREKGLPHGLVIIGQEKYPHYRLRDVIQEQGLQGQVCTPGYVSAEDLRSFYQAADLLVFPSFYEGFGLPPLEAMACGLPVVASRATCIPEVLGEAGEFFDPYKAESMAAAIWNMLSSPDRMAQLRAAGLERSRLFTCRLTAQETLKVYRETLAIPE